MVDQVYTTGAEEVYDQSTYGDVYNNENAYTVVYEGEEDNNYGEAEVYGDSVHENSEDSYEDI